MRRTQQEIQVKEAPVSLLLPSVREDTAAGRIGLSTNTGIDFIETNHILYCNSDGCYTEVMLQNGQKVILSKSLKELEDVLPREAFFRIHHSHLINLTHIKRYVRGAGGEVIMNNNRSLPVARSKKEAFMEVLGVIV